MKKQFLAIALMSIAVSAAAQKSQIRAANNALSDGDVEKAKTAIEAAVNDESTKNSAGAWYTRGLVYMNLQEKAGDAAATKFYPEAGNSFKKAISIDPGHEKQAMTNNLFAIAIYNFNDGLNAFDKQNYQAAYDNFTEVVNIAGLEEGKRFASIKNMDTIAHQSALYRGYSAYYSNRYDEALPSLVAAKGDPIVKNANIYLMLSDIYMAKNDNAAAEANFAEAKATYPDNKAIANAELNYYIKSGKQADLIKKLEEAITADPANTDLLFALGTTYDGMANPKDSKGNDLPKPANFNDLFTKAETTYLNALKADANKVDVNFNTGALYFNRAVMVNTDMNNITGSSSADIKKYDALKVQRDEWFGKALPYLERTLSTLDAKGFNNLSNDDKNTYQSSIVAMREIYAKQNKMDKVAELKAKQEAIKK